jgi:dethiobiotin synthetase
VKRGAFVTGTDTGIGKTLAACALIHALKARGVAVMPMKPVAAGATLTGGEWMNDDAVALMQAADISTARRADVTPILLREPMAPHIAAQREDRRIAMAPIAEAFARLAEGGSFVVAEGVGGFRVPLDRDLDTVDLARALALPVVLVVGLRLGCLNHALLTAAAIEASGLTLAGWIANAVDPGMPVADENVAALRERIAAPLLGRIAFMAEPDALVASRALDVSALMVP